MKQQAPMPSGYDRRFYEFTDVSASTAAAIVVPTIIRMVAPRSVVDVGCGTGGWLRAFVDAGITDVLGMDSGQVPLDLLRIDDDRLKVVDLTDPPAVCRRFDLAVSLEVAEHLPENVADGFVQFLCSLAPVVLFSAAIPGQEGEAHVNEQWPSYWAARFAAHDFECIDVLRPQIWDVDTIDWFYRQNMVLYVRSSDRSRVSIPEEATVLPAPPMALVHPVTFTSYRTRAERQLSTPLSFRAHVKALPSALNRAVRRRIRSTTWIQGRRPLS
jgi:SAM-dependent methyltransferase